VAARASRRAKWVKTTVGDVLTLTPPLIVTAAQMDTALRILDECLAEVERAHP
jgi:(R)-1-hydroxy-2-aminoethylphosphonate ammonia-lyase